jgi:predicted  nucleic acid-binding Zn-ribbon protein
MLEKVLESTAYLGAGVSAIIVVALLLRKLASTYGAENSVIQTLRDEIDRLAKTNKTLSDATAALQQEVIALRNENIQLQGEIAALRHENAHLTKEVLKLNEQITKWDSKCEHCMHRINEDNL